MSPAIIFRAIRADIFSVVPRPRRNILPNRMYLVSQEGNKKHPVYLDDEDRDVATRLLHVCALRYGVQVLAFGYGEHEGRWLLRPSNRRGLSCLMRDMQSTYSRYLNQKYDHRPCCAHRRNAGRPPCHPAGDPIRNSSNWTARFKAVEIDPEHYDQALARIASLSLPRSCRKQVTQPPIRRRHHGRYSPLFRINPLPTKEIAYFLSG